MTQSDLQTLHDGLIRQGKLIEAGWVSLRIAAIPADAPQVQLDEMRTAFFAGAQHLFSTIMQVLDPGAEPTDADMLRMATVDQELRNFINEYEVRNAPARGRA